MFPSGLFPNVYPSPAPTGAKQVKRAQACFHLKEPVVLRGRNYYNESKTTRFDVTPAEFAFDPATGVRILYAGTIVFVPASNIAAVEYYDQTTWE